MSRSRSLALLAAAAAACSSAADSLCQSVGECRAQSEEEVRACREQAKELSREADQSGCGALLAAYFSCADDRFDCAGDEPTFAGCGTSRASAEACLSAASSSNACGELDARLSGCGPRSGASGLLPPTCSDAGVCAARCWLDAVTDPCAPLPDELAAAARCAGTCPL